MKHLSPPILLAKLLLMSAICIDLRQTALGYGIAEENAPSASRSRSGDRTALGACGDRAYDIRERIMNNPLSDITKQQLDDWVMKCLDRKANKKTAQLESVAKDIKEKLIKMHRQLSDPDRKEQLREIIGKINKTFPPQVAGWENSSSDGGTVD